MQAPGRMESVARYILKSYFDEYVTGLDSNIDCSKLPITLRNLKLKGKRIQEDMDENGESPFEFSDGQIGVVQLAVSWRGVIQINLSDIILNLRFSPFKAIKKAFGPAEEKEDNEDDLINQVPMDIQEKLAAMAPQNRYPQNALQPSTCPPPVQLPQARFCADHNSTEKRKKGDRRPFTCQSCNNRLETTYVDCKLCPVCADKENRCVCCGAPAVAAGANTSAPSAPAGPEASMNTVCRGLQAPQPTPQPLRDTHLGPQQTPTPVFCSKHGTSEQRRKAEPRSHECQKCRGSIQTNYANLAYCPGCSQQISKCMICGASKDGARSDEGHGPQENGNIPEIRDFHLSDRERDLPPPPPRIERPSDGPHRTTSQRTDQTWAPPSAKQASYGPTGYRDSPQGGSWQVGRDPGRSSMEAIPPAPPYHGGHR